MFKNKFNIKKEMIIIAISLAIGVIATVGVATKAYSDTVVNDLSQKFIRFHVLANSDIAEDQNLKLKVRDGVLESMKSEISQCESIEETRELLKSSFSKIERVSEEIIAREGYNYSAKVSLENVMFPTKNYGDVVLVAGMYEALRIELGEAKGKNWWCVVYPPLCYVDVTQGKVSEANSITIDKQVLKNNLKNDLSDKEYKFVVENDDVSVKVKFKVVELWQQYELAKEEKRNIAKEKITAMKN